MRLVLMVKEPVAGRAKTRLSRGVGVGRAIGFYRKATAATVSRLAADPRWETLLAIAPDTALATRAIASRCPRIRQGAGDLGQRMQRVMDRLPPGPVIIVGTDIAGVRPDEIALAFRRLGHNQAVFGPASDGGYWLVGLRRRPRILKTFDNVRWSSAAALADTVANLPGGSVAMVATLQDVDEPEDYARSGMVAVRRVLPTT